MIFWQNTLDLWRNQERRLEHLDELSNRGCCPRWSSQSDDYQGRRESAILSRIFTTEPNFSRPVLTVVFEALAKQAHS
jgi:hypothetical protein